MCKPIFFYQAGFNAGDQKNYYSIPGAQTDAVINLTRTSNVGIPGKWVFQVDGDSILDIKCSHAGKSRIGTVMTLNIKLNMQLHNFIQMNKKKPLNDQF